MKFNFFAAAFLATCAVAGYSTAGYAADISKAQETAEFRVKVASCKAIAKTDGVKASSSEFYGYMAGCLDRVTVAVNVAPAK